MPGLLVFNARRSGCGFLVGGGLCVIAYRRVAGKLTLKAQSVRITLSETEVDSAKVKWKRVGGCWILQVPDEPMVCGRPSETRKGLELFSYRNGTLRLLMPHIALQRGDTSYNKQEEIGLTAEASWQKIAGIVRPVLMVSELKVVGSPDEDSLPKQVHSTRSYVLTEACKVRKPTPAERKHIKKDQEDSEI